MGNPIKKLYEKKNLEDLVQIEHINGLMYGIANYREKDDFQGIFDRYKKDVLKDKEFQSFMGYQMEYYAKNRLVTLSYSVSSPPDPRLQGKPALFYLHDGGDRILVDFLSLYFYLPKGKPLTAENLIIL